MISVEDAERFATESHEGQVDKAGEPYVGHLLRVAAAIREGQRQSDQASTDPRWLSSCEAIEVQVVGLFHDIVEDTSVTLLDLQSIGCSSAIVDAVEAMTHRADEPYDDYLGRVAANPLARQVKGYDIADNADEARNALLPESDREYYRQKYQSARLRLAEWSAFWDAATADVGAEASNPPA